MSLRTEKKNIITQIETLNSIGQRPRLPEGIDSFSSMNNKKEALPFLLDMLTQLKGSVAVKASVGNLLTKFVDDITPDLKTTLKSQLTPFNANQTLPTQFTNNGYNIPVKNIDYANKLKTNPSSNVGSLLYGSPTGFDKIAYDSIGAAGTDLNFSNSKIKYNDGLDTFTIKPQNGSQTIGDYVTGFIDSIELINKKELNAAIINIIFGTITKSQDKSIEEVIEEEKVDVIIDKLINEDELEFTDAEISDIQIQAANKINGVNLLDLGCGYFTTNLSIEQVDEAVNAITNTSDPEEVVNQLNSVLENSTGGVDLGKDEITAKDSFFKKIIKAIQKFLIKSITVAPQIMILKTVIGGFKNNNIINSVDVLTNIKESKKLSECISGDVKSRINKYYFNLIKTELLKIVTRVSKVILKEKLNSYVAILRSLTF